MNNPEVFKLLLEVVVYLILGILLSLFTAFTNKKEDKYWWALFCLFFPVFFLAFQLLKWIVGLFIKE